jgi:hypothetical protein
LAFAGATLLVEKSRQTFDPGAELGRFSFQAETVKAWDNVHTFTVSRARLFSFASLHGNARIFRASARR